MPPTRPDPGRAMAGGRSFVDATGTPVPLRGPIRSVVATDGAVGAVLLDLGAQLAGCAGALDGVLAVGTDRAPDHAAIAELRPDVIVTGTADGVHDLVEPTQVWALSQIAPVIAVDLGRAAAAIADLRALLGPVRPPRPPTTLA